MITNKSVQIIILRSIAIDMIMATTMSDCPEILERPRIRYCIFVYLVLTIKYYFWEQKQATNIEHYNNVGTCKDTLS